MQRPDPHAGLEDLTRGLVLYLYDLFDGYPEGLALLPADDEELAAWLARTPGFPGPLAVGVCARSALGGPLAHALQEVRNSSGVLVLCDVTDDAQDDGGPAVQGCGAVDVVEVHHSSEIAGAVMEALAGDAPLVVDVRLSHQESAVLLHRTGSAGAPNAGERDSSTRRAPR